MPSENSAPSPELLDPQEVIRRRAEACQAVVDDAINRRLEVQEFLDGLKLAGATSAEAEDYGRQYVQRMEAVRALDIDNQPPLGVDHPARDTTPEDLDDEHREAFRQDREVRTREAAAQADEERRDAVETMAWKVLESKLRRLQPAKQPLETTRNFESQLAALFREREHTSSSLFPASILQAAPHLKALSTSSFDDPHLGATWRLRRVYQGDVEGVIDGMRGQNISQPLPRSIWKLIIEDRYVDFAKLFASMDPGYDPYDDPKDFGGGYALVKKDHLSVKRPVHTESDWIRVFGAWESGVIILFPHRKAELLGYRRRVDNIFRAAPEDPLAAIGFDIEARQHYEKSPFHMDDLNLLQAPLLTQMFCAHSHGLKRGSDSQAGPSSSSKRASVICHNWNYGSCADPCINRRKHGTCSECGSQHRALDSEPCFALLQARRNKNTSVAAADDHV
jgi:uncharacterized membrane protein